MITDTSEKGLENLICAALTTLDESSPTTLWCGSVRAATEPVGSRATPMTTTGSIAWT